jgi:hypothetical protein
MRHSLLPSFCVALVLLTTACHGGSATVTSTLPGKTLELHTVFGWIQTTTTTIDPMTSAWTQKTLDADKRPLFIVASGGSFDPTQDLRFLSATDLFQVSLDDQRLGYLYFVIPDSSKVATGQALQLIPIGATPDPAVMSSGQFALGWGYKKLQNVAAVDLALPLGGKVTTAVSFSQVPHKLNDPFAAILAVQYATTMGDPANALAGTVSVKLSGQLVSETLGPCNGAYVGFGAGSAISCTADR